MAHRMSAESTNVLNMSHNLSRTLATATMSNMRNAAERTNDGTSTVLESVSVSAGTVHQITLFFQQSLRHFFDHFCQLLDIRRDLNPSLPSVTGHAPGIGKPRNNTHHQLIYSTQIASCTCVHVPRV
jgi:hypothetical protein